jgi:flagellin
MVKAPDHSKNCFNRKDAIEMRIQHNIMAMNAYRNYNNNTSALSSNLEKLSSGYKINRAGDDAAGLAISEKMRAQISGLDQAESNVKDGISLVKTGEGAMQEVQDMLNRMVTLATQSANGTYDEETDRDNLQKEVDALTEEINRIADSANFNGIKLLDGSLQSGTTVGASDIATGLNVTEHRDNATAEQKMEFSISLDGFSVDATAAASTDAIAITAGDAIVTISIGGQSVNLGAVVNQNAAGSGNGNTTVKITAGDLVLSGGAADVTLANITYDITLSNNTLTFKAKTAPASAGDLITSGDRAFTISGNAAGTGVNTCTSTADSSYNNQIQIISDGRVAEGAVQAQATMQLDATKLADGNQITIGDDTYTIDYSKDYDPTSTDKTIGVKQLLDSNGKLDATGIEKTAAAITKAAGTNAKFTVGAAGDTLSIVSLTATTNGDYDLSTDDLVKAAVSIKSSGTAGKALELQIGDTADSYNQLKVSIEDIHASALGIDSISIAKQSDAQAAIDVIKKAINTVSSTRGTLGAIQNRLEHTSNNLSVMAENIQDAESTIRDTDVAEEMMSYTKNNILVQSAQAMLAQANSVPQGVLQLLQ